MKSFVALSLLSGASAFPWVVNVPGVTDPRDFVKRQQNPEGPGSAAQCPFNAQHQNAAPIAEGQYNNARNGRKGNERGGYRVPAAGDTVHQFQAPRAGRDIRGPCPGLNTAANHNFLARDGITTYTELVDMQQNVYNVGYDLANLLAFLGLQADGDLVTGKLSIGCEATSRTSINPVLTGSQPGLAGHNKFEGDTSLTRNDFFTGGGDNFSFNRTLYDNMARTTGGLHNLQNLAKYRGERWDQSVVENPNFYFGPLSLLLFGAASFLYELFPSGPNYIPDQATMESFFVRERLPDNWINRVAPYSNRLVTQEILKMYLLNPRPFGGNTADGSFDAINWRAIQNGTLQLGIEAPETACLLYQLATQSVPSTLNGIVTPTVEALSFFASRVQPAFDNLGCPRPLTK
ncbi:Aromatic peroxygenase [Pseudocercospora fuligena]|uniref:Aromatic peroxygenase n=1 Tax=Pseudocercospora fuligena TaxID=685502 RepID=A0A8H6RGR5_9PEZI|nr:Aromatic peroxygenase [Pseudocercospora fuligena]